MVSVLDEMCHVVESSEGGEVLTSFCDIVEEGVIKDEEVAGNDYDEYGLV